MKMRAICFAFLPERKKIKDEQVYFALSRRWITLGGFESTKSPCFVLKLEQKG